MGKFTITVKSKRREINLTFHAKTPEDRVDFRVQPSKHRRLVNTLLAGALDERGILLERGSGSVLGVAKAFRRLGWEVSGVPDFKTSETVL